MTIIETRQPFRDEYAPDTVVAHDETIDKLGRIFQGFVDGYQPPHLLVHGDRGSGKRTVTRHILNLAELEVEQEIEVITIDCDEHTSVYQIYVELAFKICEEDNQNGKHLTYLEEKIFQQMDDPGRTWYFLLENIEALDEHNLPFDDLQKSISTCGSDNTECGVIGISNNPGLNEYLSGDVLHKSRMHTLKTTPYDATQLRRILELHAEVAFTDGRLSEGVIPKCAAIAAQETGSATEALQLLELASFVAYQSNAEQITEAHVGTAAESREALKLYTIFTQDLNPKEQLLCAIIAVYTRVDDEGAIIPGDSELDEEILSTDALYNIYKNSCGSFGLDKVTKRRVEQLLRSLRDRGLVGINRHNDGRRGGMWSSHELLVPPHLIFQPAAATSGRFIRFFRNHYVSDDNLTIADDEVDIKAFLSDEWP